MRCSCFVRVNRAMSCFICAAAWQMSYSMHVLNRSKVEEKEEKKQIQDGVFVMTTQAGS